MSSPVPEQVKARTPTAVIEMIETQLERAREAGERVAREGSVVRDMKGAVIPHPAIAIEAAAQKLAAGLLKDWSR
jgi:uncharacterized protein (DUF342 family)